MDKVVVRFKDNWMRAKRKENLNTAIYCKKVISQDAQQKNKISEYNAIASKYSGL